MTLYTGPVIIFLMFDNTVDINLPKPETVYMHHTRSVVRIYASVKYPPLVPRMASRLPGAKPLSEPMLEYC